jgi:hypothetical protein
MSDLIVSLTLAILPICLLLVLMKKVNDLSRDALTLKTLMLMQTSKTSCGAQCEKASVSSLGA